MPEPTLTVLAERLEHLERRVGDLERKRIAPPQAVVPPPPILDREWNRDPVPALPPTASPILAPVDLERFLGSRVLPWVGSLAVLGGLITLATYAIRQGWITDSLQFGLGITLSLLAVLLGIQRESRQDVPIGPILVALGSVGLSNLIVAGHGKFQLYPGSVSVIALTVWSLLNIAYGAWRGSSWFATLGALGCFLAAYHTIDTNAFAACLMAGSGILSASLVAGLQRWPRHAMVLSAGALLGSCNLMYEAPGDGIWLVGLALIAPLAAYARSAPKPHDPYLLWPPVAVALTTAILWFYLAWVGTNPPVVVIVALMGLGLSAAGLLAPHSSQERTVVIGSGLTLAFVLAPMAWPTWGPTLAWLGSLALLALLLAYRLRNPAVLAGAWVVLVGFYTGTQQADLALTGPWPWWLTVTSATVPLVSLGLARISALTLGERDIKSGMGYALAAFAGYGCVNDFASPVLGPGGAGLTEAASWTLGMALYGLGLLPLGLMLRSQILRYASFAVIGMTTLKFVAEDLQSLDPVIRIGLLLGLGSLVLLASYSIYLRPRAKSPS